jgi:YD repeat-containing protein
MAGAYAGFTAESTDTGGHLVINVYDKTGRLAEVRDGIDVTAYEYFNNGALKKVTLPNGVTSEYTYHENNNLKTLLNKNGYVTI